jgi:F5/8 type C domain/Secretion system C-terminal sorting domain/Fibronectin type III domain
MHSSFAYFGGPTPFAYQFSEGTQLMGYPVTPSGLQFGGSQVKINSGIQGPSGGSGGYLSVSSNGTDPNTGILWAYQAQSGCNANNNNCHGILHAVNANDVSKTELWNSDMVSVDQITIFNKFSCPTIAGGKVFIAANKNQLFCYGLKTNTTCITNIALGRPVTASSGSNASNVVDGNLTTSWTSSNQDANTIFINLGSDYDICRVAINWNSGAFAKNFNLKVSEDGINWTTFKTVVGNKLNYTEFNSVVTAKFIEMEGVKRNAGNAYSITEFQVFGSLASGCRAPTGLAAVTVTPNSEHISWDAVSAADTYTVEYHNYLSPEWLTKTVNTNSVDLTALSCGTLYYYTIQANCGAVPSEINSGGFIPSGCPQTPCDIFPVRYYDLDLGYTDLAGSTCKNGNVYTMTGSGNDIGGIADQFHFTFTNNDNLDYEALGHLIQQDQVFPSNKLGIMVRDSLTSTSRFAYMASVNNGANFIFEYRDVAGGPVTTGTFPASIQNPWMKVTKTGTNYTGYISADNISWTQTGASVDLHFGNDPANIPNYGMAVTSADNTGLSSGQIQAFTFDLLNGNPLPVKLLNFSAKAVNHDHVLVSWATAMEHLADYFIVLRSVDGKSFETIDKVPAVGESQTPRYYSINDNKPVAGTSYYRLKEVDKDGNFYLSPIVSVKFDVPTGFEIYPNPAADFTNINSLRDGMLEIRLFDVTGKLLRAIQPGGVQTYQLNIAELPKGVYFVSVKTKTSIYRQKLIKQ